jgi:hypothetical protein
MVAVTLAATLLTAAKTCWVWQERSLKAAEYAAEAESWSADASKTRANPGRIARCLRRRGPLLARDRPPGYTIIEVARELDIDTRWIYRGIAKGRIEISKDSRYGCHVFPRAKAAVARMKQLKCGKVHQLIFRK